MAESCKKQLGSCKTAFFGNIPGGSLLPTQQAAEKAIKALYISKKLVFPYIHDIAQLLSSLEKSGIIIPKEIQSASRLTLYAAQTRYPGLDGPVSEEEYREAVAMAELVVLWADKYIKTR